MLASDQFPASSSSPFLSPLPVLTARTEQASREDGLKITPGLRPLSRQSIAFSSGSATREDPWAAKPMSRTNIGRGSDEGPVKRARIGDIVGPAIEAMPPQENNRIMETFQDRLRLGEICLQLQADADQRSNELKALKLQTRALLLKRAESRLEKELLEEKAKAIRSKKREEEPVCVVCLTEHASHVIVPCGHLVLCGECCSLPMDTCPLCRENCQHKLRVFRP
eukprot:TRINITY_DN46657_c0_g1_i1.p1 TRINITY_DN46657_c0_g1~~TRINITY_DN46657_c0_g1_i1.p1  ORF type:complete len:251 (+),score=31.45 TRINITY_DN46657_c0_g1_i1:83-754(+)